MHNIEGFFPLNENVRGTFLPPHHLHLPAVSSGVPKYKGSEQDFVWGIFFPSCSAGAPSLGLVAY